MDNTLLSIALLLGCDIDMDYYNSLEQCERVEYLIVKIADLLGA